MCGRFTHRLTWQDIVNLYRLTLPRQSPPGLAPTFNAAPTQILPIIRPLGRKPEDGRELVMAGWGLIPYWIKDLGARAYSTINARADSIRDKPSYRQSFERRRCLVPATGWYEWQEVGARRKRPLHMSPTASPWAFAGIWDVWRGDGGPGVLSFAIVTTDAAPGIRQYHPRMPVILEERQFETWMRGTPDEAASLMVPYPGDIDAWEVTAAVGDPRNNRPELLHRVAMF
jgi:putative SOS response-associated peptidase YedK